MISPLGFLSKCLTRNPSQNHISATAFLLILHALRVQSSQPRKKDWTTITLSSFDSVSVRTCLHMSRDSSVGIETTYGLDDPIGVRFPARAWNFS
jgi:hypothetical protein